MTYERAHKLASEIIKLGGAASVYNGYVPSGATESTTGVATSTPKFAISVAERLKIKYYVAALAFEHVLY